MQTGIHIRRRPPSARYRGIARDDRSQGVERHHRSWRRLGVAAGGPSAFLRGRPLANREGRSREIGVAEGVPALGLDGLSSSAYGPEAALSILVAAGAAGLADLGPIMLVILALLAILFVSYWQTIKAYPISGGAYTVAKENLGVNASLLASAGIMVDYVLNVAVGISAGVAALVSAAPALHPYTLPLCLGILVLLTFVNLRGTMDAGRLFALPTYLFIACFMIARPWRLCRRGERRTSATGGNTAGAAKSRRGDWPMAIAAGVRQRLHGDDRRRGDKQRCRCISRAVRDQRPSDARCDCRNFGPPARRYRLPRDVLRHYGHGPRGSI